MRILIPKDYPFIAPKIYCLTKIPHPNINFLSGEVQIAMLQPTEWIPVLRLSFNIQSNGFSLNFVLFALELVMIQPNIECVPQNEMNLKIVEIFQSDLICFERIIEENKMDSSLTFEFFNKIDLIEERNWGDFQFSFNNPRMDIEKKPVNLINEELEVHQQHKKEQIFKNLNQQLQDFESKRRLREDDFLINPFLKKLKISTK